MEGSPHRTSLWGHKFTFCFCTFLFSILGAKGDKTHNHATMSVSAPHLYYTCPEGATAKLECVTRGTTLHKNDIVKLNWLFTPHSDQQCLIPNGPHKIANGHSHGNHSLPPGLKYEFLDHDFWLILENVTHAEQGRYCCIVKDVVVDHHRKTVVQRHQSFVILQVTPRRNGSQNCTVWDPTPSGDSVAVALAIAACILAVLSLPLILVLVYKQRQNAHSSRRGQELVRMDSEGQGHENPVFLGESPQIKTRTVSQIMTRQSSETGRHLLSEPGTPLSPPAHGDVFFPIEDTIPESPDFLQV